MTSWHLEYLTEQQAALMREWFPNAELTRDLSWPQAGALVLEVVSEGAKYVVKAGGHLSHHIDREITAHLTATAPLVSIQRAARLVKSDRNAKLLVTEYLEGNLVQGSDAEFDPETYRQAGRLLRAFHSQTARIDDEGEERETKRAIAYLDAEHRIDPALELRARTILDSYRPSAVTVVPTHGDWHPRNWLVDSGEVKVIDFGRFDFRQPASDLCRLAVQQWRDDRTLETAFIDGYGIDPRDSELWRALILREAIGTAVWAYQVGDEQFEAQGHRMLGDALAAF